MSPFTCHRTGGSGIRITLSAVRYASCSYLSPGCPTPQASPEFQSTHAAHTCCHASVAVPKALVHAVQYACCSGVLQCSPPIATYAALVFFSCSLSHTIEICAVLLVSVGRVRGNLIETQVTCHDLPGIGDRMRERAALSCSHRFRQRWQDVAIRVFDCGTPGSGIRNTCSATRSASCSYLS